MTTIYDAYGEDGDFIYGNGGVGSGVVVSTDSSSHRIAYARCGIGFQYLTYGARLWSTPLASGWFSCRVAADDSTINGSNDCFMLVDPNNVPRIAMHISGSTANGPYEIYKVASDGTRTLLGTTMNGFTNGPSTPDKFDVNWNYSTTGMLALYINGGLSSRSRAT